MSDFNVGKFSTVSNTNLDVSNRVIPQNKDISKESVSSSLKDRDNVNISKEASIDKKIKTNIDIFPNEMGKNTFYRGQNIDCDDKRGNHNNYPIHNDPWNPSGNDYPNGHHDNYPIHNDPWNPSGNDYPNGHHDNYPIHNDPWNPSGNDYPLNSDVMRKEYNFALQEGNAGKLLNLAKIENNQNLLFDVTAGEILNKSFEIGLAKSDSRALLEIAKYENQNNLMPNITAESVLYSSYKSAVSNKDINTLIGIAQYERDNNVMSNVSYDEIINTINNIRYDY